MKFRVIFAACVVAIVGLPMTTFSVLGQQQSMKEQLVGTWTLLSWEQKKGDGSKSRIAPISVTSWISRLPEADIVTGERQVAVAPKRT